MKMSILNIIISFFLIFQFALENFDILSNMSNVSKANELLIIQECGDGCRLIQFFIWTKCICPPKPREKTDL